MSNEPVSVLDVANYILEKQGVMSTMKLQKLVYSSQAWSLVWDQRPLFSESIQAWREGPVVKELFHHHQGKRDLAPGDLKRGTSKNLSVSARETIDTVLKSYGHYDGLTLSEMTHEERPWIEARGELSEFDPSAAKILYTSMQRYSASL